MDSKQQKAAATRTKKQRVLRAPKEKIENVDVGATLVVAQNPVAPDRPQISVPFNLASQLNRRTNLRTQQTNIKKALLTFIEQNFDAFLNDYQIISEDPQLRARIFIEIMKMVIPRPAPTELQADDETQTAVYQRLFGVQKKQ